MAEHPTTPADWYADPADPSLHRWWDGTGWTDRLRPGAPLRTVADFRHAPTSPPVSVADFRHGPTGLPVSERFDFDLRRPTQDAAAHVMLAPRFGGHRAARVPVVDRRVVVPNHSATAAVVLGAAAAIAFGLLRNLDLSLSLGFAPALIALVVSCVAAVRASRTGAGITRCALAFVLAIPLTGFAIWAFGQEIFGLVHSVG